ncbi:lipocalin family protein [Pedobacter foliorum]|uniref:lipocalin family protein n=1 Tax=Pedobacter foliorum TaxID=2739058 RepID=UPI001563146B|nr:lipocalin family protein [Pedobacter foliorum]NRF39127.1 lipocalin family protein [Pedobacter foliorum]
MKTTIAKLAILAGVFYFSLASCSKKENDPEKDEVEGEIDTDKLPGMWKLTAHIVGGKDIINERGDECIRDNSIFFFSEDDLLFDEGLLKCSPADPMIPRGKYEYNTEHTQIKTTIGDKKVTYKILTLNATTLKLQNTANNEQFIYTKSNVTVVINPNGLVGSWQITGHTVNGVETLESQTSCIADDIYTFTSENKMYIDDMQRICKPGEPATTIGSYTINTSQTKMVTNIGGITEDLDVLMLTVTTLVIEQDSKKERITFVRR